MGRVQCKNIKTQCPKAACPDPILLPGRCCKICPGSEDESKNSCQLILNESWDLLQNSDNFMLCVALVFLQNYFLFLSPTVTILSYSKCPWRLFMSISWVTAAAKSKLSYDDFWVNYHVSHSLCPGGSKLQSSKLKLCRTPKELRSSQEHGKDVGAYEQQTCSLG